jgi:hypothetical protein
MSMISKGNIWLNATTISLPSIVRKLPITTAVSTATRMSASRKGIGAKEGVCPAIKKALHSRLFNVGPGGAFPHKLCIYLRNLLSL